VVAIKLWGKNVWLTQVLFTVAYPNANTNPPNPNLTYPICPPAHFSAQHWYPS